MTPALAQDQAGIAGVLEHTLQDALRVIASLDTRAVACATAPQAPQALSRTGTGFASALADFNARYAAGFAASAGPRYLGFVTGGATPAALAADWLVSCYDQNPTSGIDGSAPDLERETLAQLRELFGLDNGFSGAFVTGATLSNFVGLALGREWVGEHRGLQVSESGIAALGAVHILSGAPHSSIFKAASMLGLGRQAVETLPLLAGREAVDIAALEARLAGLQGEACIVVANAGTVNSVDFDDLAAIGALRERYPFWLHIDAAFGAFAALAPAAADRVNGLSEADSICIDLHKWLNVPYDAAVQFTRRQDLQLRVFRNSAAYLGAPGATPDFVHLTPENSRRLRALPTWFALRAYGRDGVRDIVERCIRHAQRLAAHIDASPDFVALAPTRLNVVCFTLRDNAEGAAGEAKVQSFVMRVRDAGEAFVTPTFHHGRWGVRAAFSNWRTRDEDVERVWLALKAALPD
ncbi:pyridoxal phosphate-dependent decarboxylase family protein [Paludibacterium yongneupense]|uniref:pyridoxal phosphate-dependent decarboxylase family protein n=1 Tax=Paludibacterium yongneupense TaxID=400061 RepID=UPI00041DC5E4|nr:pyridoxal-dependent decarboxylase [Paludibacterium yongneupense]